MAFRLGGRLTIRRLGLGAMRLPTREFNGPARDPETGKQVLRRAVELGVNHIDTADFYQSGDGSVRANALIREALDPRHNANVVIATKVGPVLGPKGLGQAPASPLRHLVEENLEALGLDRLDLVYLRVGLMEVPRGESIGVRFDVLAKLREEGLIQHLGLSNVDTKHLTEARTIAPVAAVQNNFNISGRQDLSMLDACTDSGIAFVPFFPLGGGHAEIANDRLAKVAARHGATIPQIGLAWLLHLSPVTLASPGTSSLAHLEENVAAQTIKLTEVDLAELGDPQANERFRSYRSAHNSLQLPR